MRRLTKRERIELEWTERKITNLNALQWAAERCVDRRVNGDPSRCGRCAYRDSKYCTSLLIRDAYAVIKDYDDAKYDKQITSQLAAQRAASDAAWRCENMPKLNAREFTLLRTLLHDQQAKWAAETEQCELSLLGTRTDVPAATAYDKIRYLCGRRDDANAALKRLSDLEKYYQEQEAKCENEQ